MINFFLFIILPLLATPVSMSQTEATGTITMRFANIEEPEGKMRYGLFRNQEEFLEDGKQFRKGFLEVTSTEDMLFKLEDIPYGEYSIAVYHDVNGNHVLDKCFMGFPCEPYAFSGGPIGKWRIPKFKSTSFEFNQERLEVVLELNRWINQ